MGYLIFQEQIALLAHKLGKNLSLDEGNMLRKLLTKKGTTGKTYEKKKKIYQKFIEGLQKRRASPNTSSRKSFGKPLNTSQDMVLISPTLLATAFLAISVPIFLITIPLSGWHRTLTKSQKAERNELSILCKALGIE